MRQTLAEYAITFFTLLAEGHKSQVLEMRKLIQIASYPHFDDETRETIRSTLMLPEDILADILEDEKVDDVSKIKSIFADDNEELNGN